MRARKLIVCNGTALMGQTVTVTPEKGAGRYFAGFTSDQAGCQGLTYSFSASKPVKIEKQFLQLSELEMVIANGPEKINLTSDKNDAIGNQALKCQGQGAASSPVYWCTAMLPVGTTLTISATSSINGSPPTPVAANRFSGACKGTAAGSCVATVSKPDEIVYGEIK